MSTHVGQLFRLKEISLDKFFALREIDMDTSVTQQVTIGNVIT